MAPADVLWAPWDAPGLEHLRWSGDAGFVRASSLIIATDEGGRPFRARYTLECDAGWRLRRARIELLEDPSRALDVRADGPGRRIDAATGAVLPLDVAFVPLPELVIRRAPQEYTLLERAADGTRWRFRSLDSEFTAELTADRDGLVLDYPGIACRVR